jgi:putative DNA primase/helicase
MPFKLYIPENERKPNYSNTFNNELPGIFNWAIEGLIRLKARQHLIVTEAMKDVMDEYRRESDTVFEWASEAIYIDPTNKEFITARSLYPTYREATEAKKRNPCNETAFAKRFKNYVNERLMHIHTLPAKNLDLLCRQGNARGYTHLSARKPEVMSHVKSLLAGVSN